MMALDPIDIDWLVAEIEINDGATTDQFNASQSATNVVLVLDELVAWATVTFVPTFSWSWQRESATGGAIITISCTGGSFTLEATNTDAQDGYGYPAGAQGPATDIEADASAAGTWAPTWPIGLRADLRVLPDGDACGDGGIRPGVPGLAHRSPIATAAGTARDAARLAAMLALSANPRRATAYQTHTGLWLSFALGDVERSPVDGVNYRFDLEAVGDTL